MTPNTTPKLSIKPFTATRSIRFVVARYVVSRTVFISSADSASESTILLGGVVSARLRLTKGDSSASTWRVRRAEEARRWVGRGTEIVLKVAVSGQVKENIFVS